MRPSERPRFCRQRRRLSSVAHSAGTNSRPSGPVEASAIRIRSISEATCTDTPSATGCSARPARGPDTRGPGGMRAHAKLSPDGSAHRERLRPASILSSRGAQPPRGLLDPLIDLSAATTCRCGRSEHDRPAVERARDSPITTNRESLASSHNIPIGSNPSSCERDGSPARPARAAAAGDQRPVRIVIPRHPTERSSPHACNASTRSQAADADTVSHERSSTAHDQAATRVPLREPRATTADNKDLRLSWA